MNNENETLIDLFSDEVNKKKKRDEKKLEKLKRKEERKKQKEEKRLAKIEDKAFALKQKKEDELKKQEEKLRQAEEKNIEDSFNIIEEKIEEEKDIQSDLNDIFMMKENIKNYNEPTMLEFLSDTIFGFFIITIILTAIGYNIYEYLNKSLDIIYGSILLALSVTFAISLSVKKQGFKKFFTIISSILFTIFICYQLFM